MPMPHIMAKTNRYWINPVVRHIAGRIPPLILVHHVGRTSGKAYNTPVWAFRHGSGFIIALTYGPRTDWLRNFEAAGSCTADYRSRSHTLSNPRLVHGDPRAQPLPWIVRQALVVLGVHDFLLADARISE